MPLTFSEVCMVPMRIFLGLYLCLLCLSNPAAGDSYQVILRGSVKMQDGSPPPKSVGIQRICSDSAGSAPGPITDRKGGFIWRLEVDPLKTRVCHLEASLPGYVSSGIDISALNGTSTEVTLAPIVLSPRVLDPYTIVTPDNGPPSKAASAWKGAIKAIEAGNMADAATQMQAAVKAAPQFAQGWHALGVVYEQEQMKAEARDAYEKAIAADPKFLPPYVTLVRICIGSKDWQSAAKTADAMIKADSKKVFPVMYLHQAVARFQLKDLANAEMSAQEAVRLKMIRAEFVLGRILEAKGDLNGAREHISKYIELDKNAGDIEMIKAYLENLGKGTGGAEPALELL